MIDPQQKEGLLSVLLDALDDLYDQRFGWPPHRAEGQIAEVSLRRILFAASLALEGSEWEERLGDAAGAIDELLRSGARGEQLNDLVLNATADLRTELASEA